MVGRMDRNTDLKTSDGSSSVKSQNVSLDLLVNISQTLASLVQGMLGPCGQQTLLSSPTGKVLVSRAGWAVLSSLHLAHPLARCMMDSLRSFHAAHHDGSKTFVLYLAEMLKAVSRHVEAQGPCQHAHFFTLRLSAELNQFLSTDFQQIKMGLVEKLSHYSPGEDGDDLVSKARAVVKTSLHTCIQKNLVDFFTDFLCAFLSLESRSPSSCLGFLSDVLQYFDMYCTKVPSQPQQKSMVCQGILLETNLQPFLRTQTTTDGMSSKSKRFVLMEIDFDEEKQQRNGTFIKASSKTMADFFTYKRNSLKKILTDLRNLSVQILLTSDSVPQFVLGICKEMGLAVETVDAEKIVFLRHLTGVTILKDFNQEGLGDCIFTAHVNSFVHIGNKVSTLIQLDAKCSSLSPVTHMVVCAPTEGLCDQLSHSLYKALKSLHLCLQGYDSKTCTMLDQSKTFVESGVRNADHATSAACVVNSDCAEHSKLAPSFQNKVPPSCSDTSMLTVASGGAFEAALTTAITDFYTARKSHLNQHFAGLIKKMLMVVPQTLHANLTSSKQRVQRRFTDKWTRILAMTREGQPTGFHLHGDVRECGFVEPVAMTQEGQPTGFDLHGSVCDVKGCGFVAPVAMAQEGRPTGFDLHGNVSDVKGRGFVEPVTSKLLLVEHVLQLVVQLLRVESMVPVRRLPVRVSDPSPEGEPCGSDDDDGGGGDFG